MDYYAAYRLLPALWVAVSLALYFALLFADALVANLRHTWLNSPLSQVNRFPAGIIVVRGIVKLLAFLVIPYIALMRGDIIPRLMGLSNLNWVHDVGMGVALSLLIATVTWLAFRPGISMRARQTRGEYVAPAWASCLLSAALLQTQWAFFRAAGVQVIGDQHWGALAALLPIGIALLGEGRLGNLRGERASVLFPSAGAGYGWPANLLLRIALAVSTTAMYLYVPNLVFLILAHWLTELFLQELPAATLGPAGSFHQEKAER